VYIVAVDFEMQRNICSCNITPDGGARFTLQGL
jgi:hypothetical protein